MDMQLTSFSPASNFLLVIGVGLILSSIVYLRFLSKVGKTRKQFRALQPEVRITSSATVYSNGEDVLTINLRNSGGSPAKDIRVTVHGGEGVEPMPIIPQLNSWVTQEEVWVKARPDSPLLHEKRKNIRLIIRYRDQWGYRYTLTYPVVQRESTYGWVTLQLVDRGKPRVSMPLVSYWQMRRHITRHARQIRKGKIKDTTFRGQINISHDDSLSHSLIHSYLGKVWQTQNKHCQITNRLKYHHPRTGASPSRL